jgi:outer membrane immunogenic protein
MKKELMAATALTATAAAALVPGAALAQTVVPYNWTGIYLGLGAGLAQSNDVVATDIYGSARFARQWTVGTIAAGINWDAGNILLGFEGDVNFLGTRNEGSTDGDAPGDNTSVETDLDRLLTLRARLGVKANRAMFFATGGLAVANASLDTSHFDIGKTDDASGSGSRSLFGWTVGGGTEIAATNNLAINFTALYYRLQPLSVTATGGGVPYTATYTPQGWLFRAGLSVKLH